MIIQSWNIQGLHKSLKQKEVQRMASDLKVDVLCLLETKLDERKAGFFSNNFFAGWNIHTNCGASLGGRIILLWNSSTTVLDVILTEAQVIHCTVRCKISNSLFYCSFIYGFWKVATRRPLWDSFRDPRLDTNLPWLILGDFNVIKTPDERVGGVRPKEYEMDEFNDFCLSLEFCDADSFGARFTWSNASGSVRSKLDRVMINNLWLDKDWICKVNFLPRGIFSDHSPAVVNLFQPMVSAPKPFKFQNMWISHPSFENIVTNNWLEWVAGTKQFRLVRRLKLLQRHLKELNAKEYANISLKSKDAKDALEAAEIEAETNPLNGELAEKIPPLRNKALFLAEAERRFFCQKAKTTHLLKSDRNTRFFHSLVKRNAMKNKILYLTRPDGSVIEDMNQISSEFVQYYEELFGSHAVLNPPLMNIINSGPVLNAEDSLMLDSYVTKEEIRAALFDIGDDKAPGPDGFTAAFFKASWDTTGHDLTEAVLEFFRHGKLLKQLNHTIIALIPKVTHNAGVGDFRPIACCNIAYKLITKIISNRLAALMPKLISLPQSAFVKGRIITDNIFLAQELIRKYNYKRNAPKCTLKIDLRKAYDSISWEFLFDLLIGLGFPLSFAGWIKECVSTASFSIAINGELHGFIQGKRGIRQGDPMSPYLFLLCMEYFSRLLNTRTIQREFNFHAKCSSLKITHLAFADDLMLFSRGDEHSVGILMDTLKEFEESSGLRINSNKSSLFTAGIFGADLDAIRARVGFSIGEWPIRYLGIPLDTKRLCVQDYSPLIEKIISKINAWSCKSLSFAGRLELIQSVLQGTVCYWLQIFPLPMSCLDRITSLCRNFLWGTKWAHVAWESITKPKDEGGLGLRHLPTWNRAFLAKTIWNIQRKADSLWVKWVHGEILKEGDFWSWSPHPKDSALFKNLHALMSSIRTTNLFDIDKTINLFQDWFCRGEGTSDAYNWLRDKGQKKLWHNYIWRPFIPPKFSFITWLAVLGRLPTRDRLNFLNISQTCPLCSTGLESSKHLFFECRITSSIWNNIKLWLGIRVGNSTILSTIKWCKRSRTGAAIKNKARRCALTAIVYFIWKARNLLVFEGKTFDPGDVERRVKVHIYTSLFSLYHTDSVTSCLGS